MVKNFGKSTVRPLGKDKTKTENRFRIVEFSDYDGKSIHVCTNIRDIDPDRIAEIIKLVGMLGAFLDL